MMSSRSFSLLFLAAGITIAALAGLLVFSGALNPYSKTEPDLSAYGPPEPRFEPVSFDALPGWRNDAVEAALPALLQSCLRIERLPDGAPANPHENLGGAFEGQSVSGVARIWKDACAIARATDEAPYANQDARADAIRSFFEDAFSPVLIRQVRHPVAGKTKTGALHESTGAFTGYFEPTYQARNRAEGRFTAPLYSRPKDLIDVDLSQFRSSLAGERVVGRLEGGRLVPYEDRSAINRGALKDRTDVLAYLDPNDLFFLQIQGSGQLEMPDGTVRRVGYAGANGQPYTAIGRILVQDGTMPLEDVSMQSILDWLRNADPADAQALREANESYVFFRELTPPPVGFGPLGAQGAPLLPGRSLAIDRRYHALGAPVYVDITPLDEDSEPIRKLMIAQDTGGAIKGPIRGDYFWGAGPHAAQAAGKMNAQGRLFVLLPNAQAEMFTQHLNGAKS